MQSVPFLNNSAWWGYSELKHAFFGRRGGCSETPFDSLNVSYDVGDEPRCLARNWCDAKVAIGAHKNRVTAMEQVHSCEVHEVIAETGKVAGKCDALITRTPGCFLAVQTADCVPIFIVEPDRKIAAAVHAGRRGTLGGIVMKTIQALEHRYDVSPDTLQACIGPCIQECCYSVGEDVAEEFEKSWPNGDSPLDVVTENGECYYLDLRELNRQQMHKAGIGQGDIHCVGSCTACNTSDYFSHRAENGKTGRQLSLIGWVQ
ncbi:MAG: peptidoglycan editing factor PgeF [Planctomycetota bacterium]|nr:peptidoglycan editing factor PgeF [Planctomycetota bacterium]MDA1139117.1 peptidoglycan editing factor PgeF [Planctomycetota bacterium]